MDEIEDGGSMDRHGGQKPDRKSWKDRVGDDTRISQNWTEFMNKDVAGDEIVPQVIRKVKRTGQILQNTRETLEAKEKAEMIWKRLTHYESLKLAVEWIGQSMKMIQAEAFFWNGVHEVCRKVHGMKGRLKHSLPCE